jgi:hypothetical protein
MDSWFIDDFDNYNTYTILGSKQPTDLEKERIFKVIEYIATSSVPNIAVEYSNKFHNMIISIVRENISYIEKYDKLKSEIKGCETNECLLMHVAKAYGLTPKSLLMETIAIHSRIRKLDNKDAWFDNFSLNSFLLQLTTIVYSEYDNNNDKFVKSITFESENNSNNSENNSENNSNTSKNNSKNTSKNTSKNNSKNKNMTGGDFELNMEMENTEYEDFENMRNLIYDLEMSNINLKPKPKENSLSGGNNSNSNSHSKINTNIQLTNPLQLLFHLGNNYRTFIEFGTPADKVKDNDKAIEMLDKLNEKYPYYTGCTHGCDVFTPDFRDKSVSIFDIHEFCQRYPYSIVGYILNTKTYRSGKGQHWMALIFKGNSVYLICSQGSGFNSFEEKTLEKELEECGFAKEWNTKTIQIDHSSCGLYSVLSNLSFIMNAGGTRKPNIEQVVNMIGKEGKGINNEGIYTIKQKLAGFDK